MNPDQTILIQFFDTLLRLCLRSFESTHSHFYSYSPSIHIHICLNYSLLPFPFLLPFLLSLSFTPPHHTSTTHHTTNLLAWFLSLSSFLLLLFLFLFLFLFPPSHPTARFRSSDPPPDYLTLDTLMPPPPWCKTMPICIRTAHNLTQATKEQIEDLFSSQGPIKEVKLIKNYGFIEFDSLDDAVRAKENVDGQALNGEPLFCTYANPIKVREPRTYRDRNDRNDRGGDRKEDIYRVNISGLAPGVSWQDLKDFGRTADVDVTYTNVSRDREGEGTVEFRSADQMEQAVSKLDGTEFKGEIVTLKIDVSIVIMSEANDHRDETDWVQPSQTMN